MSPATPNVVVAAVERHKSAAGATAVLTLPNVSPGRQLTVWLGTDIRLTWHSALTCLLG